MRVAITEFADKHFEMTFMRWAQLALYCYFLIRSFPPKLFDFKEMHNWCVFFRFISELKNTVWELLFFSFKNKNV
jgi:hypothetical protein